MKKVTDSKFESLWKLMSEHNFTLDPDSIHDDLLCMLCDRLIVDACQTRCGCQYCYKCISDYLARGSKYCPGGKSECKLELLKKDLLKDPKTNNKIWKTNVLCPNSFCKSKIELSKMEVHLQLCKMQSNDGASLGANNMGQDNNAILDLVHSEIYANSELIMNNIKNEFDGFKGSLEKLRIENENLKRALATKDIQINQFGNMRAELTNKEVRLTDLETNLEELRRERRTQTADIGNMKVELRNKENKILALEKQIKDIKMEKNTDQERHEMELQLVEEQMIYKTDKLERKLICYSKWNDLCPNIDLDFAWKIEHLSKKKRLNLFSDPFYCNDYKLCMCLNISGDQVALWCHIMRGDKDNTLDWPMLEKVTLSILDQDTLIPCKTETYQYDTYFFKFKWVFKQPKTEKNNSGIGTRSFVRYSSIKDIPSVIVNDSIVVSCEINSDHSTDSSSTD